MLKDEERRKEKKKGKGKEREAEPDRSLGQYTYLGTIKTRAFSVPPGMSRRLEV
jgi:hypothetical protein